MNVGKIKQTENTVKDAQNDKLIEKTEISVGLAKHRNPFPLMSTTPTEIQQFQFQFQFQFLT